MYRRVLLLLLLVGLLSPSFVLAGSLEEEFKLSQLDSQNILKNISGRLTEFGTLHFVSLNPEEQLATFLVRNELKKSYINFLPGFISTETVKLVIGAAKVFGEISQATIRSIISKLEQYTVDEAIKAGTDWLIGNQIHTSSGEFLTMYESHFGGEAKAEFQYIILYKNDTFIPHNNLFFELYSPNYISPPLESSVRRLPWEKGDWLRKDEDKIPPFVVRVETVVDEKRGWYIDSKATKVKVEFPDEVPRLELARELPYPIEEQKINLLNKLTAVKKIFDALGSAGIEVFNTVGKGVGLVKDTAESFFSFISKAISLGGAGLVDPFQKESKGLDAVEDQLNLVKKQLEAKQNQAKLNSIKENSIEPEENLIPFSLPQEQPEPIESSEVELNGIKDEPVPLENEVVLNEIKEEKNEPKEERLNLAKEICEVGATTPTALGDVIINEVGWMGTPVSANDEWIELKNISNSTVSLLGWRLFDKDAQVNIVFGESHVIPTKEWFLLERTDDTTVPDVVADLIYTGALSNSNEALYLFDAACVLRDRVAVLSDWPAGDNANKKSMERSGDLSWYTYKGSKDDIFGTPKQENSSTGLLNQLQNSLLAESQSESTTVNPGSITGSVSSNANVLQQICSQENVSLSGATHPVIINEVAWMGTTASANDEWIELKNTSNDEVSLAGWQLLDKDEQVKIIFGDGEHLAPGDFYLLERTDDTSLPNITANSVYTGSLNNNNESLRLFYANCNLADEVIANPDWPGGDNDGKKTLERKPDLSWQTYYGESGTGTPKATNSTQPVSPPPPSPSPSPSPPPSPPSPPPPETTTKTVVMNEIAWMGTAASANDEWIELYNTTAAEIDLGGWKLQAEDGTPSIELAGTIGTSSYFLLERTDDTTIFDVAADFIYTGALGNAGEVLRLYDAGDVLVDKVDASSSWSAGDNTIKQSMERVSVLEEGVESTNWADNNLITHNSKDASGNYVNGTPRQQNSVSLLSTTISSLRLSEFNSITLTKLGSPYSAVWLTVPAGKTLIIEPGVRVEFENNRGSLAVEGTLTAVGQQNSRITFTSDNASNWCGLTFTSTSLNSELNYTTIEKSSSGGAGCGGNQYAVWVKDTDITLKNSSVVSGNSYRKLHLENSNSLIDTLTISGAVTNNDSAAIYIEGGSPSIKNSTIKDSSIGVWSDGGLSTPTIQSNTFTGNIYPVKLSSSGAALSLNTATSNTYNGILVEGHVSYADVTWKTDLPYIMSTFTVQEGKILTLEAGVVVKLAKLSIPDPELVVNGTLLTQGTAGNQIVFTKLNDDTVGGDTNEGGLSSTVYWKRIRFASTSTGSALNHTVAKYGGNTIGDGVLRVEGELDLQNAIVQDSPNVGLYSSGTLTGSNITLADNSYAFNLDVAQCPALANVSISGSGEGFYPGSLECTF